MLASIRRPAAALTAVVLAGCGAEATPGVAWVPADVPASSAGGSSALPSATTGPSPAGTASPAPSASRSRTASPARAATTRAAATATATAGSSSLRITNLSLSVPDENGLGEPVHAIPQDGCSTTRTSIGYTVTVPGGRWRQAWYEYAVAAPTPLRGRSDDYEFVRNGDRSNVRTVIAPIEAEPANRNGGTVTITVVVVSEAGVRVTSRISADLLPCA